MQRRTYLFIGDIAETDNIYAKLDDRYTGKEFKEGDLNSKKYIYRDSNVSYSDREEVSLIREAMAFIAGIVMAG